MRVFPPRFFAALLWSASRFAGRFKGDAPFPSAPKRQQAAALQRAQWGVILLLVAAGLHCDIRDTRRIATEYRKQKGGPPGAAPLSSTTKNTTLLVVQRLNRVTRVLHYQRSLGLNDMASVQHKADRVSVGELSDHDDVTLEVGGSAGCRKQLGKQYEIRSPAWHLP